MGIRLHAHRGAGLLCGQCAGVSSGAVHPLQGLLDGLKAARCVRVGQYVHIKRGDAMIEDELAMLLGDVPELDYAHVAADVAVVKAPEKPAHPLDGLRNNIRDAFWLDGQASARNQKASEELDLLMKDVPELGV